MSETNESNTVDITLYRNPSNSDIQMVSLQPLPPFTSFSKELTCSTSLSTSSIIIPIAWHVFVMPSLLLISSYFLSWICHHNYCRVTINTSNMQKICIFPLLSKDSSSFEGCNPYKTGSQVWTLCVYNIFYYFEAFVSIMLVLLSFEQCIGLL